MASGGRGVLEAGVAHELPQVGDWVLSGEELCQVRFVGKTQFAKGVWVGVALKAPTGKNNGTVQGVTYFECEEKCGLFVRPTMLGKPVRPIPKAKVSVDEVGEKTLLPAQHEARRSAEVRGRLSMAIDEHDIGTLKELLPMAQACGVRDKDVAEARDLVAYAGRNVLIQELTDVRLAVERLGRAVQEVELRAAELEQSSKISMSGKADLRPNAKASDMFDRDVVEDWLSKLGGLLEQKVWSSLEKKVTQVVHESVLLASRELIEAASSVRHHGGRESTGEAAQLDAARHEAATRIQRTYRGRCEREAVRPDAAQDKAATSIQRFYRSKASRDGQDAAYQAKHNAATHIQRVFRGQHARGQLWGRCGNGLSGAALRLRARHEAWADIFDEIASQDNLMDAAGFESAMRQIYSWLSAGQANAVWRGYASGAGTLDENGSIGMSFQDFCCVVKAGVHGEEAMAEFADISVETFQLLGSASPAQAARIQALHRGRMARREKAKRATAASQLQAFFRRRKATLSAKGIHHLDALVNYMRSRHQAFVELFENELSSGGYPGREVDQCGFARLLMQIQPAFSSAQAVAVYKGYTRGCNLTGIDLRGFIIIAQAIAGGDMRAAAEFADMSASMFGYLGSQDAERAAIRMQAARRGQVDRRAFAARAKAKTDMRSKAATRVQSIFRRWRAMRIAEGRRRDLREAALIAKRRVEAWGELYDIEVERGNIDFGCLTESGFANMMANIQPAFSAAQAHAIFKGFVDTIGAHGIDFESLCYIGEEVVASDVQAGARIADLPVASFTQLGSPEALAAARGVQAVFRGGAS